MIPTFEPGTRCETCGETIDAHGICSPYCPQWDCTDEWDDEDAWAE